MAEIGTGETEIHPVESIKRKLKEKAGNLRKAFAVTGMARRTPLPSEEVAQKQAEVKKLSSEARTLGGDIISNVPEQLQERLTETRAEIQSALQSEKGANGKSLNPERTLDERSERGKMYRIIRQIRIKRATAITDGEKGIWNQRSHAALEIFNNLARNLDTLNRQYYSPEYMQFVGVEVLGEQVGIPVLRYSLRDKNATPDGKVPPPIIIIAGATSGPTVTKGTAEAFALQYPNRDVYVIGYPNSKNSKISPDLPGKLKEHGDLATYTKINKDVLLKMGFESFDLIGLSMGGGIVLQAATDAEFAKRINNLIAISPTNIQETKGKMKIGFDLFAREILRLRIHPREWTRLPQKQPGSTLGSHKGMEFAAINEIVRRHELSSDDLARLHVQGRMIIVTGDKDAVISCEQTKKETEAANEKRAVSGKRPIEFMAVLGGHHGLGVVQAAGLVGLIRNTDKLPDQINVKDVPTTTAELFVRDQIT